MWSLRNRLTPQTLRWQFTLALAGLALLMVAGGATTLYEFRVVTRITQQLSEERLQRMQEAHELVQSTLLIERELYQLASTESYDAMRDIYASIVKHLSESDQLAERLTSGENDIAVLGLHRSSQLFRNEVNIVAQLRERELRSAAAPGSPESVPPSARDVAAEGRLQEKEYAEKLHRQAAAMVTAAQRQSERHTQEYRRAIRALAETSAQNQRWVMVLLAGSLLLAWLIAKTFLGRHVLARLQLVSRGLHRSEVANGKVIVPVQGNDEIAEMARAVEKFQEDRRTLVQRSVELEATNRELEELSYAMSHEMLAPLRALDGFSQMLLESHGARLDDEGKRMLMVLSDRSRHQGRLVNDILRFLALSRRSMEYASIDMVELATELFKVQQAAVPERCLRLEIGALPPAWGDRDLIRQALQNLLSNAVKFSPAATETVIEVGGTVNEKESIYFVRDHGIGFDMRYAHKLFKVFERIHPTGQYEGTAMGLAFVKRVIDRHGGQVWAESREGEGATFHFSLPRKAA